MTNQMAHRMPPNMGAVIGAHTRIAFKEMIRNSGSLFGNFFMPILFLLFYVVPSDTGPETKEATTGFILQIVSLVAFSCTLFTVAIVTAMDKKDGYSEYLHPLPINRFPRLIAHALTVIAQVLVGGVAMVSIGIALTSMEFSWHLVGLIPAVLWTVLMWALMGGILGLIFQIRTVSSILQVLYFILAVAGGMYVPPDALQGYADLFSRLTPSRASRDLIVYSGFGYFEWSAAIYIGVWILILLGAFAVVAGRIRKPGRG
ncbi:MAG: ABC transporter permease [Corynebacterium sp.]|nr:ABC transporter permease [Corynebacterium sp.]